VEVRLEREGKETGDVEYYKNFYSQLEEAMTIRGLGKWR
jgi:hypothetical protein